MTQSLSGSTPAGFRLNGKVALTADGTRDIGLAMAGTFAETGA
jgi:hypothetical protein